jgi:hypothetical protein
MRPYVFISLLAGWNLIYHINNSTTHRSRDKGATRCMALMPPLWLHFDCAVFIVRNRQEQGAGKAHPRIAADIGTTRGQRNLSSGFEQPKTYCICMVLCYTHIDMTTRERPTSHAARTLSLAEDDGCVRWLSGLTRRPVAYSSCVRLRMHTSGVHKRLMSAASRGCGCGPGSLCSKECQR